MNELIEEDKVGIVDELYDYLNKLEETNHYIKDDDLLRQLKKQQIKYFNELADAECALRHTQILTGALVHHHHESYDGSGYPDGLSRDEIPFLAQILRIVDAYVAMISDRPYRVHISGQDALIELARFSGRKFDPELTRQFIEYIKNTDD